MGFGWSLLDIAKHATSTFISTLGDEDPHDRHVLVGRQDCRSGS